MFRAALRALTASAPPHGGRLERKYLLPPLRGADPVALVLARVPGLRREHSPRQVSSLYLDSTGLACYQQSNAGASERVKLRLRWYGALQPATRLVLELKYRANLLGWKSLYPLEGIDLANVPLRELPARFARVVTPGERPLVELLRSAVLVTSYYRHYLATWDGRVRVTVDTAVRCYDQRLRPRLNLRFDGLGGNGTVVECKLAAEHAREAARLLRALSPNHRFSKYCDSFERLART